jgi:hypothetical protein
MSYRPIVSATSADLVATALVGQHAVILGFDLRDPATRHDLLGFAIHRAEPDARRADWLKGQLRFQENPGDWGEDVRSDEGPFQKFHWGDYTTRPGRRYVYTIHAVRGTPRAPRLDAGVTLDVTTDGNPGGAPGLWFNRGGTASLAYRTRFGDKDPDTFTDDRAWRWLSRGLHEALLAFLARAGAGDLLQVAIYEFEYPTVSAALQEARTRGARVQLLFHARPGDRATTENEAHVQPLGWPPADVVARTNLGSGGISHNKFVVLHRAGAPTAVWTGSTNWTENGFFYQTNLGVAWDDATVADAYARCFAVLWQDLPRADTKRALKALVAAHGRPAPGTRLFFSPVSEKELLEVAEEMIAGARHAVFVSAPFGLHKSLIDAITTNANGVLEYGLVNATNFGRVERALAVIDRSPDTLFVAGRTVKEFDGRAWDAGKRGAHLIHVKSIVTDPWGPTPKVLLGSANFSDESVTRNDENAVYFEGDPRVAAIVAVEFVRMFDHYKFRHFFARTEAPAARGERWLTPDGSWTASYFAAGHPKDRDRRVFVGG